MSTIMISEKGRVVALAAALCMCVVGFGFMAGRPIVVEAHTPTGDPISSARSCGDLVVQRRPRLVVFDVTSRGATCKQARNLLAKQHKAQEPRGKHLGNPDKILLCQQSSASGLTCRRDGVRINLRIGGHEAI